MADWTQIGRFVAGLDSFYDSTGHFQYGEFQRADCAPRGALGDGCIGLADWVQAGRYALGLDPVVPAGGPSSPASMPCAPPTFSLATGAYNSIQSVTISTTPGAATIRYTTDGTIPSSTVGTLYSSPVAIGATCTLQAMAYEAGLANSTVTSCAYTITSSSALLKAVRRIPVPLSALAVQPAMLRAGVTGTVDITLTARGNETALGFTLNFDPKLLHFAGAHLGSGTNSGVLNVNASQAGQGHLGLVLSMPLPKTVTTGKQIVLALSFVPISSRTQSTLLSFGDLVVAREVVSANADVLPASYTNGTVSIAGMH